MKKLILFIIIIVICTFLFFKFKKNNYVLLNDTIENNVTIDKYYIYGNHLNLTGTFDIENYDTLTLVFKNLDKELNYDLYIENNNFKTSIYINDGIYLDDLDIGNYFIFLKSTYNGVINYYNLTNKTKYNNLEYYTISSKKKKININYSSYSNKEYFEINIKNEEIPNEYYDIVIDAGHGGDDPGASFSNHNESNITLDFALALKKSLEENNIKVKLTRDNDTTLNSYGLNSRTSTVYESHAKYVFSIHLNSCDAKIKKGGVEIYSPSNSNLEFAKSIADNIVESAKTNYSKNESFKVLDGVYVRTFTKNDINDSITTAEKNNYSPYPIDTNTTYYFMIRETGGIATNAYIDGRNKNYDKNYYYDSNIGAEGYLLELGYINYWPDLNNLIDNKNNYIEGIAKAIIEELDIIL